GWRSMARALQKSRNAAAVDLLIHLTGIDPVIGTARAMGLHADLPPYPALTLGVANITPIEMAEAFDTFPNMGVHVKHACIKAIYHPGQPAPILVENDEGPNAVRSRSNRALSESTGYKMVRIMQLVVQAGTG